MTKKSIIKGAVVATVLGIVVAGLDDYFTLKITHQLMTANENPTNDFKYVALGDSITFGYGIADKSLVYPQIVSKQLGFKSCMSLATDGASIADVSAMQVPIIPLDTNVISLFVGGNDFQSYAFNPMASNKLLRQLNKKYLILLQAIRKRVPHAHIFIMNFPELDKLIFPVDKFPGFPYQDLNVRAKGATCLNNLNSFLSTLKGSIVIDNKADARLGQKVSIGADGIHPSVDGQSFYAENLVKGIQKHYNIETPLVDYTINIKSMEEII